MKLDFLKNILLPAQRFADKVLHTRKESEAPAAAPRPLNSKTIPEDSWIRLFLDPKQLDKATEDEDDSVWHLGISGGGLLGFFPAEVLYRIDQRLQGDVDTAFSAASMDLVEFNAYAVPDFFNNVQAISTGSIIGTLLSVKDEQGMPQNTRQVLQLYLEEDPNVDTPVDERVFYRWSPEKRSEVLWHKMDKFLKKAKTGDTCWGLGLRVLADTELDRKTIAFGTQGYTDVLASDAIVASCAYPGALNKKDINGVSYIDTGTEVPPMHCAQLFIDFTVAELHTMNPKKPEITLVLLGTGIFSNQKEEINALIEEANKLQTEAGLPTISYYHVEPKEEGVFKKGLGDHVFNPHSIPSLLDHAESTLTGENALAYSSPFKDPTLEALYQRIKGRMLVRIYKLQKHIEASESSHSLDFSLKTLRALGLERYGRLCLNVLESRLDDLALKALNLSGSLDPKNAFNLNAAEKILTALSQSPAIKQLKTLDLRGNDTLAAGAQKSLAALKAKNARLKVLV